MQNPKDILSRLGMTEAEINVYLAMLGGAESVADIMKATRQKRPTVYYVLGKLEENGLLEHTGKSGRGRYAVASPERLKTIVAREEQRLGRLNEELDALIPSLKIGSSRKSDRPHIAFFEGVEAVKNVIMETLYHKDGHIDSIAPNDNFFWQIGDGFADAYVAERVRRGIKTRNLWEGPIDRKLFDRYYSKLSDIRLMPDVMRGRFVTTVFLYDDKTLYISSLENAYALLVTSKEHHDTMKALFDGLWATSEAQ